jgi:hypothetical protein
VQLDIGNVEQVTGTDNLLGGHAHHADTGGVAADFGGPEAEQLLVLLDTFAGDGGRRPLEVHNTLNLDGGLAEEVHIGEFVDRDGLALKHTSNILLISGPLEGGPLHLLLGCDVTLNGSRRSEVV